MAQYPIKMLKDEQGKPFVPVVSANTISLMSGYDLQTEMDKKLMAENIIAGKNITVKKEGNNCTIGGPDIMNNLTTDASNKGVLDAYQGKVLNDKIDNLSYNDLHDLPTIDTALSTTSTNAVENQAVTKEINKKVDKKEGYDLSKNDFTDALKNKLDGIEAGAQVNTVTGVKGNSETDYRTGNINITKANIGLGNVENKSSATIRSEITSKNVTDGLGFTPMDSAIKGVAGGVAELDATGKVPASQLPAFIDDVAEYDSKDDFPATGENNKIYIAKDKNITYRWSGSSYVPIGSDLALGETSSTAYPGDKGAAAYAHAVTNRGSAFASGFYKVTTNSEGHVTGAIAVQKNDITSLGIPGQDTTYENATQTVAGLMSATDKTKLDKLATVATTGSYKNLVDTPTIPTKVSELTNDENYLSTESDPTVPAHVKAITQANITAWNNKSTFSGDYNDLSNKPSIPTKVGELTNDAGYITGYTETDPTVPAWAKAANKPTYTAAEVGALPSTTKIPSKTSDITNDSGFITDTQLNSAVQGKQDKLTAGDNIKIESGVISAEVEETGTKSFIWSSSSSTGDATDKARAQEILDAYLAGEMFNISFTRNAQYSGLYVIDTVNTNSARLWFTTQGRINTSSVSNNELGTQCQVGEKFGLRISYSDGKVTGVENSMSTNYLMERFLATDTNYSTPYTPQYPGSPATKKYVDDSISSISISPEITVVDNLTSDDGQVALSANQGRLLNENKVDKVSGKALSTNDFTTAYKNNVDANTTARHTHSNIDALNSVTAAKIAAWDAKSTFSGNYNDLTNKPTIPSKVSQLSNDVGYITSYAETDPTVPSHVKNITTTDISNWNAKTSFDGKYSSLSGVPTKLSQFTNDPGFITSTVSNLSNYYNKTTIDSMLNSISTLNIEVVSSLPTTGNATTIYLVSKSSTGTNDAYDEYIYSNSKWEKIGSTQVDLSNYYTKAQIDAKGYLTSYTETDPTVPAWAKAASKPTYTAAEVGALPATTKIPTIHTGTTEPASSLGANGDIYIMKF